MYTKGISDSPILPKAGITHLFNALLSMPDMNSSEKGSTYFSPTKYHIHGNSSRRYLAN
jgi:hypothetical protein